MNQSDAEMRSAEILAGQSLRWCVRLLYFEKEFEESKIQYESGSFYDALCSGLDQAEGI